MIEFRYRVAGNDKSYRCNLNLSKNLGVNIKFDTGASSTVISAASLRLSNSGLSLLKEYMQSKFTVRMNFKAASGSDFDGYLCCAHNVVLGGSVIKKFYYFLTMQDRKLALLGVDYTHGGVNGSLFITSFNQDDYFDNLSGCRYVDSFEINEVCNAELTAELISERIQKNGVRGLDDSLSRKD